MQFRWVAAITVWTFISGPLLGPPHAPILQRDNQRSPLRQVAEQPPRRAPNTTSKLTSSSPHDGTITREAAPPDPSSVPALSRAR